MTAKDVFNYKNFPNEEIKGPLLPTFNHHARKALANTLRRINVIGKEKGVVP